jgi:crossover junction endodeoxyribonuclease RusA
MDIFLENLPLAPSVNHVWKHRVIGRRAMVYMSKEGVEFRSKIAQIVREKQLHNLKLESRLQVKIELLMRDKRRVDIDNRVKSCLDALTHAGIWLDDSQIDILTVVRCGIVKGGLMHVLVREL